MSVLLLSLSVLAVDAATATSGPLGKNPDYSATARFKSDSGLQQLVLWLVLVLAVVVLGWFSFRLTRREE